MEYKNLFLDKSEKELNTLYEQYLEWNKMGMLGDNELGEIRDIYCTMGFNAPLLAMELDLLRTIAKHWYVGK